MPATPLISIALPVYNTAAYLDQCLHSLRTQTFRDFEIIAIDDASSDGSWEILERHAQEDTRLRILRHERNSGMPSRARNEAIKMARGKYLALVDSDDYIDATLLEKAYQTMLACDADMGYCDRAHVDDRTGKVVGITDFSTHKNKLDGTHVFNYQNANEDFWRTYNGYGCFRMLRLAFLHAHTLTFDESVEMSEDFLFSIQCACRAKHICYIPDGLYYYRVHRQYGERSICQRKVLSSYLATLLVMDRACAYVAQHSDATFIFDALLYISYFLHHPQRRHDIPITHIEVYCNFWQNTLRKLIDSYHAQSTYFNREEQKDLARIYKFTMVEYLFIQAARLSELTRALMQSPFGKAYMQKEILRKSLVNPRYNKYSRPRRYAIYALKILARLVSKKWGGGG